MLVISNAPGSVHAISSRHVVVNKTKPRAELLIKIHPLVRATAGNNFGRNFVKFQKTLDLPLQDFYIDSIVVHDQHGPF